MVEAEAAREGSSASVGSPIAVILAVVTVGFGLMARIVQYTTGVSITGIGVLFVLPWAWGVWSDGKTGMAHRGGWITSLAFFFAAVPNSLGAALLSAMLALQGSPTGQIALVAMFQLPAFLVLRVWEPTALFALGNDRSGSIPFVFYMVFFLEMYTEMVFVTVDPLSPQWFAIALAVRGKEYSMHSPHARLLALRCKVWLLERLSPTSPKTEEAKTALQARLSHSLPAGAVRREFQSEHKHMLTLFADVLATGSAAAAVGTELCLASPLGMAPVLLSPVPEESRALVVAGLVIIFAAQVAMYLLVQRQSADLLGALKRSLDGGLGASVARASLQLTRINPLVAKRAEAAAAAAAQATSGGSAPVTPNGNGNGKAGTPSGGNKTGSPGGWKRVRASALRRASTVLDSSWTFEEAHRKFWMDHLPLLLTVTVHAVVNTVDRAAQMQLFAAAGRELGVDNLGGYDT